MRSNLGKKTAAVVGVERTSALHNRASALASNVLTHRNTSSTVSKTSVGTSQLHAEPVTGADCGLDVIWHGRPPPLLLLVSDGTPPVSVKDTTMPCRLPNSIEQLADADAASAASPTTSIDVAV
jgi:hypothetical protein